jgi:hypothetical protein
MRQAPLRWLLLLINSVLPLAAAASDEPSPDFLEVNYQDPLTAAPPIQRPQTRSCRIRVMDHAFASSFGRPFIGNYVPPAGCPGPWSMVVLDWNGSVAGRQFDRLAGVWIGGVEMLRATTPEPSPAGIQWNVEKDVSEYATILNQSQTVVVDLGNVVNPTYTGIFFITLDLTFYATGDENPPASHPDLVIPISTSSETTAWFTLTNPTAAASRTLRLPTNLTRARLEIFASGHNNEEFWYANRNTFREFQVFVDGALAAVATPFPVIYTGGINPLMWRPTPSVEAFDIPPYLVDLTPFVGILSNDQPHTIAIKVANTTSYWRVDGNLLLDQDHRVTATGGALIRDTLQPTAEVSFEESRADGVDHLETRASRSWVVEGYVDTSAGRIFTKVEQEARIENNLNITLTPSRELDVIAQTQQTTTTTTVTDERGRRHVTRIIDDYPLQAVSDFSTRTLPNGHGSFTLLGFADVALNRQIAMPHDQGQRRLSDHVIARGLLIRDTTTGQNLAADGVETEHYVARLRGRCFNHFLRAVHGYVTEDRLQHGCDEEEGDDDRD